MAEVRLPDGNVVNIPDFALESTQSRMLKALEAQLGTDSKALALYEKLLDGSKADSKKSEESRKQTETANRLRNQTLKQLLEEAQENNKAMQVAMRAGKDLGSTFRGLGSLGVAAGKLAVSITRVATDAVMGFGDTLSALVQQGVGLQDTEGAALNLISDLQSVGMSAAQASDAMGAFSGVVQTMGKQSFGAMQKQFANLTSMGSEFGMTMTEMSAVLSEDLEVRQKLGILRDMDAMTQSRRSRELFKQQMESAAILGKSIDEIRQASRAGLEDNAAVSLRIQSIAQKHNQATADEFTHMVQNFSSRLSGLGVTTDMIGQIVNESMDVVAFGSAQGQELQSTLAAVDSMAGTDLANTIRNINRASQAGDVAGARQAIKQFEQQLLQTADVDRERMQQLLAGMGGFGEQMSHVIAQVSQAGDRLEQGLDFEFPDLAESSAAFSNTLSLIQGQIGKVVTLITGNLAGPMQVFSDALTKSGEGTASVFSTIIQAGGRVSDAIMRLFSVFTQTESGTNDLRKTLNVFVDNIADKLIAQIDRFNKFLEKNNTDLTGLMQMGIDKFKSVVDTATTIVDGMASIATTITSILGWFMKTEEVTDDEGNKVTDDEGNVKTKFAGIDWTKLVKAILLAPLAKALVVGIGSVIKGVVLGGVKNIIAGAMGMGVAGGGNAAGAAASTVAGRAGSGAAGGGGLARGMRGAARGLSAFANPKILAGAAIVGGSILAIGAGIAGATWLMGKALPAFAEGLEAFEDVDGSNLVDVAKGVGALGVAMAALGAGGAMGAIGNTVANIFDGLSALMGGKSQMQKLKEFGDMQFNVDGVKRNSEAAVAFGKAMAALGGGSAVSAFGNIGSAIADGISSMFGGSTPWEKLQEFGRLDLGDGVAENANIVKAYGDALSTFSGGQVAIDDLGDTADHLDRMARIYQRFAQLNTGRMSSSVAAIKDLNNALVLGREQPAPDTTAAEPVSTGDNTQQALENMLASAGDSDSSNLISAIIDSNRTTHRLLRELNESVQNM